MDELLFVDALEKASKWLARGANSADRYGDFGRMEDEEDESSGSDGSSKSADGEASDENAEHDGASRETVHFMLQRTRLPIAHLQRDPQCSNFTSVHGVHLKQISVPKSMRRRGYATRVVDRLISEARATNLAYVFVESVITKEMHAFMRNRSDFCASPTTPNCYYLTLKPL